MVPPYPADQGGKGDAGSLPETVVPFPGAERMLRAPPAAPTRSAIPEQARATAFRGGRIEAGTIITDREAEDPVGQPDVDAHGGTRRMFGCVLHRLQTGEVRGSLGLTGQPLAVQGLRSRHPDRPGRGSGPGPWE